MDAIPIILDKERHLKWTMGGMEKFQEVTGVNVLSGNTDSFTVKEIVPFIWACLIWEDRTLKLEDVKYMVDINKMTEIIQLIPKVINAAVPQGETGPNAASLSTG